MDLQGETLSTEIDTEATPSASGAGTPSISDPEPLGKDAKPASLRDDIQAVFNEDEDKKLGKDDAKPEKEADAEGKAKPEKPDTDAKDGKEAKAEPEAKEPATDAEKQAKAPVADTEAERAEGDKAAEHEKNGHSEPPRNFLPDSREVWRNVPRVVRRDIETMAREHEAEIGQHREASERYSQIRDFDELARTNGRDLRESLTRVHQFEQQMRANPITALNMALMEVGPRKADGQPYSIREVAQYVMAQTDEGYQRIMQQGQPQQQQSQGDPQVAQLKTDNERLKAALVTASIIQPFVDKHPRYPELQPYIAMFLESDIISKSMSPVDRLATAYSMAERLSPASSAEPPAPSNDGHAERRAGEDFGGSKSIKSSPGSVTEEVESQAKPGESIRDSLRAAARGLNR